ncbi:MAG: SpoIIE family protein phosphatase [Chloroflexota bacterium]
MHMALITVKRQLNSLSLKSLLSGGVWIVLLLIGGGCAGATVSIPQANQGELDLTEWNFQTQGNVALDGEWEFYWQQLLTPNDFSSNTGLSEQMLWGDAPQPWTRHDIGETALPGTGHATYRLRFKVADTPNRYGLFMRDLNIASKVWLNGELIAANGVVGPNQDQSRPRNIPQVPFFTLSQPNNELVIQMANYYHRHGGILTSQILGLEANIRRDVIQRRFLDTFLLGSLMIMGLYYLGLFYFRNKETFTLLFSIFCLLMSLRVITTGTYLLVTVQPNFPWIWLVKVEYLTFYLGVPVLLHFFTRLYPLEFSQIIRTGTYVIAGAFALIVVFTPPAFFTTLLVSFQIITLIIALYLMGSLLRATLNRRNGALLLIIGVIILFVGFLNDVLHANYIIQTMLLSPLTFLIFIIFQSVVLSSRFSYAFTQVETLSADLQGLHQRLEQQNRDLEDTVAKRTEALVRANTQMKNELGLARQVQRGLLRSPKYDDDLVRIRCYSNAMNEVGGDFYSYHSRHTDIDERYIIAVGDVSGKGVSAALLMAAALAQFDVSLSNNLSPAERVVYLDHMLLPYAKPRRLNCALCYVELDYNTETKKWDLQAVNAAAVPPYIKRNGGSLETTEIGGFALGQGLAKTKGYPDYKTTLETGDLLILVSDGILEAQTGEGDILGFDRLEHILAATPSSNAEDALTYIRQNVFEFTKRAAQQDDYTIVVLEIL